jgi:exopolysaccharide biosynthesis polyprenyl glycosylphosphotransferase
MLTRKIKNHRRQRTKYIVADFIAAAIVWSLFFAFRKLVIEEVAYSQLDDQILKNLDFFLGVIFIPLGWLFLYYIAGYYNYIFKKTLGSDISKTFKITLIGVLVLFFTFLLDDNVRNYKNYYFTASVLFSLQFFFTLIPRLVITHLNYIGIRKGVVKFNTILIGCGPKAIEIYQELLEKQPKFGNHFVGYVKNLCNCNNEIGMLLPDLGTIDDLPDIIGRYGVEEMIIAVDPSEQKDIAEIINWLGYSEITVKAITELHHVLKGRIKMTNIMGTPLLEIEHELMPLWQQAIKKVIDIVVSVIALIILLPFFIVCAFGIKLTSKGPVFFLQERIGKSGKSFMLYKFRSMYIDAEKEGPNLSSENDNRCTTFGRFLRKTKLDEIPNFINVLKGEMSMIGPRPERQYYIDQIVKIAPNYKQLQKIKPGITSLGQVRYGYASDVDQMVKRLRFDLLYLENMTLNTDFLVIYYTILILFKGRHV